MQPTDLPLRLQKKVKESDNGCWLWTDKLRPNGYGEINWGKTQLAHRVTYELLVGSIPEGLVLDHVVCDVRHCVNPNHMEPTTIWENVLRGSGPTAVNARKTHCIRGHEFTTENTICETDSQGRNHRACRECKRTRNRVYKERKRNECHHKK